MENTLKFSVNDIQLMDDIEKNLFRKVKIKAFATGENCHTMPIEEDVLKRGAKNIYNKSIPISGLIGLQKTCDHICDYLYII